MIILSDIGGTYARFAIKDAQDPKHIQHIHKLEAATFPDFLSALTHYCQKHNLPNTGALLIATAAYEENNQWIFINQNNWIIDPKALEKAGWKVKTILNDFEAATWALLDLPENNQKLLRAGKNKSQTKCLIGPGTGLGLGYLHEPHGQPPFIQKTHGGHMPVSALNEEQHNMVALIQKAKRDKGDNTIPAFENFVSGPGLFTMYQALCQQNSIPAQAKTLKNLPSHKDTQPVQDALRLFHEFFGQCAATATITGHAYGGLYLTGGVLERLMDADLFDFKAFEKAFLLNAAQCIFRDLKATPIIYITDPTPALRGLIAYDDN